MNDKNDQRKLVKRAIVAYSGAIGMVAFSAAISLSHKAGLRPLLILLPLFILVFGGITYQFAKEWLSIKRGDRRDRA
ncbi:hypothetical protein [Burkholderia sp. MSMB0856]|uniref:hypothetical protein n=1 Tax=Burkholderia sp. MSMB0856 TaxID=1637869 RepID=UPI000D3876F6|nr:hypothetical protein [Burkholderia sp. MSMB0856]